MSRRIILTAVVLASLVPAQAWAQREPIFSQSLAERHGLRRAWLCQVELDRTRDKLFNVVLDLLDEPDPTGRVTDALFAQTNSGLVQAIDAHTGRTLWVTQTGTREALDSAPVANDRMVMCINGTTLCCLDRADGHIIWEKSLKRVPSQPASVGPDLVFIPSYTGHMTVYNLPEYDPEQRAWVPTQRESRNYLSFGQIDVPPLVTKQCLAWGTNRGFIFVCTPDQKSVRFRFDARDAISAPLGYWPPLILAASRDGYLYAVDAISGESPWRYTNGSAINQQPVAINGRVYLIPETGGMLCLSVDTGLEQWVAPRVTQFVAASSERLYVCDRLGQMLVLDALSGGQIDTLPTELFPIKVSNTLTDRIYLASQSGLITCLHEEGLVQPLVHHWPDIGTGEPSPRPAGGASEDDAEVAAPDEDAAEEDESEMEEDESDEAMEGDEEPSEDEEEDPFG